MAEQVIDIRERIEKMRIKFEDNHKSDIYDEPNLEKNINHKEKKRITNLTNEFDNQQKEEIKSKIGSFNCYIVKPFYQGKSLLKNEGDMKIWISDSEKRLPIKIQIKMKFGSMKLDLISVN